MMNLDEYKNMFKEIVEKMFVNCIVEEKERDWNTKTDYKSYKIQLNQDLKTMLGEIENILNGVGEMACYSKSMCLYEEDIEDIEKIIQKAKGDDK